MEVTLPGHALRSREHAAGAVAGWGGRVGISSREGGIVERAEPGSYCMFCLVFRTCAAELQR